MNDEERLEAIRRLYPDSVRQTPEFEERLDLFRGLNDLDSKIYESNVLHYILEHGDLEVLKILLEKGADASLQDRNEETCLHHLARCDKDVPRGNILDCARLLIDAGASPLRKNTDGQTAVYVAAEKGMHEVIEALVEKGKKLDIANNRGETPLFPACEYANSTAEHFYKYEKPQFDKFMAEPDATNESAARVQQERRADKKHYYDKSANKVESYYLTVKLLLQGGIDPDQKNNYDSTAKEIAFTCMDLRVPALLNGLDTDSGGDGTQWEMKAKGMTLPLAIVKKDHDAVEAILELGSDPNEICDVHSYTDGVECQNRTPLGIACSLLDNRSISLLIKHGANPNEKDVAGNSPISYCFRAPSNRKTFEDKIVESILEEMQKKGLETNSIVDEQGNTMLHLACENLNNGGGSNNDSIPKRFFKSLMRLKADPNVTNNNGETPLMFLCKGGDRDTENAQITLLEAGADVGAQDSSGRTPVMYAASSRDKARAKTMIEMLFEFGDPKVNAVNNTKHSALDLAVAADNEPLVNYLLTKM